MKRVGLVSCVKLKRSDASPAQELYVSPYFQKMRAHVERTCDDWRILSAKHGLLHPHTTISPYEETLKTQSRADQRAWARRVYEVICREFPPTTIFEVHAGSEYARDLVPHLEASGYRVELPLEGLSIGFRLQYYDRARTTQTAPPTPARSPTHAHDMARSTSSPPTHGKQVRPTTRTNDFAIMLHQILADAYQQGLNQLEVTAGDLHRRVGGYPGPNHRMPVCCTAMRAEMTTRDQVVESPPSGKGASLRIRYRLPRGGPRVEDGP